MFQFLGRIAARYRALLLIGWLGALVALQVVAPKWSEVVEDGEFRYIPDEFDSRQGEELFKNAFSHDLLGSSIVIVLRRENSPDGLLPRDRDFIRRVLKPRLDDIAKKAKIPPEESESGKEEPLVSNIRTLDDPAIGELLVSDDGQATLIIVELRMEFLARRLEDVLNPIEDLFPKEGPNQPGELAGQIPVGLDIKVSGTATVGRDMRVAAEESASATHLATVLLVVVLLLLIYRAPLLVLVPMATVVVSVTIAQHLLAMLAQQGFVQLFTGIEIYVQVVMYGAGVDYCMFLMARYKEELDNGASFDEAIDCSVHKVGAALAASAGTTMAGIGMMVFAQFGKFQQAGVAMSFSLFFVLAASLTFAPALLRIFGRWAFWPQMRTERIPRTGGWVTPTTLVARLMRAGFFSGLWEKMGERLRKSPGKIWLATLAAMLPFAAIGAIYHNYLSFGLLSELPEDKPSVVGTKAVQQHFPAGATGPLTVLLTNRSLQFRDENGNPTKEGLDAVDKLTTKLHEQSRELEIADLRTLTHPRGLSNAAERSEERDEKLRNEKIEQYFEEAVKEGKPRNFATRRIVHDRVTEEFNKEKQRLIAETYISNKGDLAGHVTRIDIVFEADPFSRNMLDRYAETRRIVEESLPDELRGNGTQLSFIGATASINDMKLVTNQDQIRIDVLVLVGVFVVLVALLRRPAISGYLIVSVFFSYLATLGATFVVFWALDPSGFAGLDWKVPIFLFTILIAVGEDYNIYLITRIDEEQAIHGPLDGIMVALSRTGGIISGCGIIMAGTFSSLLVGSLVGMHQLGFALAFGVLLDTFVVRTIIVPAYLMLLYSGQFGPLGKFLGAGRFLKPDSSKQNWDLGSESPSHETTTTPTEV